MSSKTNIVRAFPRDNSTNQYGMSLRDYFAAKAMQGLISDREGMKEAYRAGDVLQATAETAYMMADAMMCQRDIRHE